MRQAITTKFHSPTNTRGARVTARADAGSVSVPWNHAHGIERNHTAAARALVEKLGWGGEWHGGGLPGAGYVFVCADTASCFTAEG
ncbi:MAG TPA: hypothetical protein VNS02_05070 [Rhizobiaceae bacterium]|nr:hypothetical protein [Rhizobiaceae bacterium]